MFFKDSSNKHLMELLEQSRNIKSAVENNQISKIKTASDNSIVNEIVDNINFALGKVSHKVEDAKIRLDLITKAIQVGLWDMSVIAGDPVNPNNEFIWSNGLDKC